MKTYGKLITMLLQIKQKYVETDKKLNDHTNSYPKLINDLSGDVKLISTKRLREI